MNVHLSLTYSSVSLCTKLFIYGEMAKSSRSSNKKANNVKLKSRVFGPVEDARTERLSAKLLELASQPQPLEQDLDSFAMEVEKGIGPAYSSLGFLWVTHL